MAEIAVRATKLGKQYRLYARPSDRLRELLSFGTRRHEVFWALKDFDLEVRRGESVGIVGANGAGKSTLLKLLARKLAPTTGAIEVAGRVSSILELGTGFHSQLTGRQNARVNALFLGQRPWEIERHVERIIEFAEIGQHADQLLSTYSSGMQARLAFAALTTLDPEILILDEALATGDAKFAAKCNEYLRKLCRSGCTTLVASHDFWFLASTCDRIVWIEKGKKRAEGAPADVLQQYLDALGQDATTTAARSTNVLLRIEPALPGSQATFMINSLQWLDDAEHVLGEQHVGQQETWNTLLELAPKLGFTPEAARAGWGKAELHDGSLNRSCTPCTGPRGAAYLVLPVPAAPRPLPAKVRVAMRKAEPCDAIFALQADGAFQEIGRAGRAGPEVHPSASVVKISPDWVLLDFDVRPIFRPAGAALAPNGAS
jgi:ABC-type polysaccharide/polyol phosphate transport system ATPase subunit